MSLDYLATTFINLFALLMFAITVKNNRTIDRKQRRYFLITDFLISFICIMELLTLVCDGAPVKFRLIHIVTNYLGFGLTPAVAYSLGNAIFSERRMKFFFCLWVIYIIYLTVTQFTGGGVFRVDSENNYHRDSGFVLYLVCYFIGIIFFLIENIKLSLKFQYKNVRLIWANFIFLLISIELQVVYPQLHTTWISVIISTFFYYVYHDDLHQQVDSITGLLNYNSLLRALDPCTSDFYLILIEIDNFTKLKLNYDREKLEKILSSISKSILGFFRSQGVCYRVSSEEFCILLKKHNVDCQQMIRDFFVEYVRDNYEDEDFVLINCGHAKIMKGGKLNQALSEADRQKRKFNQERLQYLYRHTQS